MLNRIRRRLRDWWRGETDETYFPIWHLPAINAIITRHNKPAITAERSQLEAGLDGAIRWIFAKLAQDPQLQRTFPNALGYGPGGPYALWLIGPEADRLLLSQPQRDLIREAFESQPESSARLGWALRSDLREVFPLALTPHSDRAKLLNWVAEWGLTEGLNWTPEKLLWLLAICEASPDRGLFTTYQYNREWQRAVPEAATTLGWPLLKAFLKKRYGLRSRWFNTAQPVAYFRPWDEIRVLQNCLDSVPAPTEPAVLRWLASRPQLAPPSSAWLRDFRVDLSNGLPKRPGVNLLGHFSYPSGLQEAALALRDALHTQGCRTQLRDMVHRLNTVSLYYSPMPTELFDTTIQVSAVNAFPDVWLPQIGLVPRADVHRIAVWYWELEDLPTEWLERLSWPHEIWAPTSYLQRVFQKYLRQPVRLMLPGVELPAFPVKSRRDFGLPEDRFLFYFSFDMGSVMARKNPLGLIQAFRAAFHQDENVYLLIKVSRGEADPESFQSLLAAADAPNIRIINQVFSRGDTLALMNLADCYVSLHRAEGLGLGMIESMLMGKPVIGTRYSGNLDFMTDETSYLVDAGRVPVEQDATESRPYPKGCLWGDPNLEQATAWMRRIFLHPEEAREFGRRAQADLRERLSLKAYGERMVAALHNRPAAAR